MKTVEENPGDSKGPKEYKNELRGCRHRMEAAAEGL